MSNVLSITSAQLKRAATIKDEISTLETELASILGTPDASLVTPLAKPEKKRKMSASARAKIAAAQKARWAKFHAKKSKKTAK